MPRRRRTRAIRWRFQNCFVIPRMSGSCQLSPGHAASSTGSSTGTSQRRAARPAIRTGTHMAGWPRARDHACALWCGDRSAAPTCQPPIPAVSPPPCSARSRTGVVSGRDAAGRGARQADRTGGDCRRRKARRPSRRVSVLTGVFGATLPDIDKPSHLFFGRRRSPRGSTGSIRSSSTSVRTVRHGVGGAGMAVLAVTVLRAQRGATSGASTA